MRCEACEGTTSCGVQRLSDGARLWLCGQHIGEFSGAWLAGLVRFVRTP